MPSSDRVPRAGAPAVVDGPLVAPALIEGLASETRLASPAGELADGTTLGELAGVMTCLP